MSHTRHPESHTHRISAFAEVERSRHSLERMLAIEGRDVVANAAAVGTLPRQGTRNEHRGVVSERGKSIRRGIVSPCERLDEALNRGRRILGVERRSHVGTFGGDRVGDDALPAVAAEEDCVELLSLRFTENCEAAWSRLATKTIPGRLIL